MVVFPDCCSGIASSYFFDRYAHVADKPRGVTRSSNVFSCAVSKPADTAAPPMAAKPTRQDIWFIQMLIKPIDFAPEFMPAPVVPQGVIVENFGRAMKEPKLRSALRVSRGRYKSQIHLYFPQQRRASQFSCGKVRGSAPRTDLGGGGWFLSSAVRNAKHVALTNRNRQSTFSVFSKEKQCSNWKQSVRRIRSVAS